MLFFVTTVMVSKFDYSYFYIKYNFIPLTRKFLRFNVHNLNNYKNDTGKDIFYLYNYLYAVLYMFFFFKMFE